MESCRITQKISQKREQKEQEMENRSFFGEGIVLFILHILCLTLHVENSLFSILLVQPQGGLQGYICVIII